MSPKVRTPYSRRKSVKNKMKQMRDKRLEKDSQIQNQEIESEKPDFVKCHVGRRVVNVSSFVEQLQVLHKTDNCSFENMILLSEDKQGFKSGLTFKCLVCDVTKVVWTEDNDCTAFPCNPQIMPVNRAAVAGILGIGGGYSSLEEFFYILNIPCLSLKSYAEEHKFISIGWNKEILKEKESLNEKEWLESLKNDSINAQSLLIPDVNYFKRDYEELEVDFLQKYSSRREKSQTLGNIIVESQIQDPDNVPEFISQSNECEKNVPNETSIKRCLTGIQNNIGKKFVEQGNPHTENTNLFCKEIVNSKTTPACEIDQHKQSENTTEQDSLNLSACVVTQQEQIEKNEVNVSQSPHGHNGIQNADNIDLQNSCRSNITQNVYADNIKRNTENIKRNTDSFIQGTYGDNIKQNSQVNNITHQNNTEQDIQKDNFVQDIDKNNIIQNSDSEDKLNEDHNTNINVMHNKSINHEKTVVVNQKEICHSVQQSLNTETETIQQNIPNKNINVTNNLIVSMEMDIAQQNIVNEKSIPNKNINFANNQNAAIVMDPIIQLDSYIGESNRLDKNVQLEQQNFVQRVKKIKLLRKRRIVDLEYFIARLQKLGKHGKFNCKFSDMILESETTNGLSSYLSFMCKTCGTVEKVGTIKSNENRLINYACASAMSDIGRGYSSLETIFSKLDLPNISYNTFSVEKYRYEKNSEFKKFVFSETSSADSNEIELFHGLLNVSKNIEYVKELCESAYLQFSDRKTCCKRSVSFILSILRNRNAHINSEQNLKDGESSSANFKRKMSNEQSVKIKRRKAHSNSSKCKRKTKVSTSTDNCKCVMCQKIPEQISLESSGTEKNQSDKAVNNSLTAEPIAEIPIKVEMDFEVYETHETLNLEPTNELTSAVAYKNDQTLSAGVNNGYLVNHMQPIVPMQRNCLVAQNVTFNKTEPNDY